MSRMRAVGAVVAAAWLMTGCAALRTAPPVRTYRLDYPPPPPIGAPPQPVTLRIVPFGIAAAADRDGFIYRSGPYDVGLDPYNRWIANPASLITDLLARDLVAAKIVQAVLQTASGVSIDYELSGQVETLEEDDADGGCSARLRLRVLLVHAAPNGRRSIMQETLAADESCVRGDPDSYAAAMSRAVQRVSEMLRASILAALAPS